VLETATYIPKVQDLASVYSTAPHEQLSDQELAAWHRWVRARFLEETEGITVRYLDYQPYHKVREMIRDVKQFKALAVSREYNHDPLLPGKLNLMYRAAHDLVHVELGAEFDWKGELAVARHSIAETYDQPLIQQIIFSETVLQTAHAVVFNEFRSDQPFVRVGTEIIEMLLAGALS
jgi:hypothetical protein